MASRKVAALDLTDGTNTQVFAANSDRLNFRIENSVDSSNDVQVYADMVDDPADDGKLLADLAPGDSIQDLSNSNEPFEIGRLSVKMIGAGTATVIGVEYGKYAPQA